MYPISVMRIGAQKGVRLVLKTRITKAQRHKAAKEGSYPLRACAFVPLRLHFLRLQDRPLASTALHAVCYAGFQMMQNRDRAMRFEAIIFDMDGVLVDSEAYWLESRVAFAAGLGKTWTLADQHAAMGRNTVEWAAVMRDRLGLTDWPLDAIIEPVRGGVIRRLEARVPLLPGALDAVQTAASIAPIALASGSPTAVIDTVMRLSGLETVFAVKVYGDDIPNGKPAPDIYFEAARQLGARPSRCLGIEDSANGLRALYAAGMTAIAVPSPGFSLPPEVLAPADRVLPSLEFFTPGLLKDFGRCEG